MAKSKIKKVLLSVFCVLLALILGLGVTALSAFMPKYLATSADFYTIEYGFPFEFILQTTTMVPNIGYFPTYFTPKYDHESFETELMMEPLVASSVVNVLAFGVIIVAIVVLHSLYRKKHPKKIRVSKKDLYRPVFSEEANKE